MPATKSTGSAFESFIQKLESKAHPSIEDWELVGEALGEGGFGVTYLAKRERSIGRRKIFIRGAIKLVNLEQGISGSRIGALIEELTKLSSFNSRYIANIMDAGIYEAAPKFYLPYFVMDYIEGDSLANILKKLKRRQLTSLPPWQFKNLALNTLRALLTAHDAKILHLDIKPANIMYSSKDQTFVLIDFGIARFIEQDLLDGVAGGTLGYVAPEVFLQKAVHASDVFSLGLSFYEALTLRRPVMDQMRIMLRNNPNLNPYSTQVLQAATKNMVLDFSLLTDDQRALIEPMLQQNPKQRPSLDKLIELANQLHVPDTSSPKIAQSSIAREVYESWENMGTHLTQLITDAGTGQAHIVVDDTQHFRLWFRTSVVDQTVLITCPTPKNTIALGRLGWKAVAGDMHEKPVSDNVQDVSDAILKAMKIGFSLKPPVSITNRNVV